MDNPQTPEKTKEESAKTLSRRDFVKSSVATLSVAALTTGCASLAKTTRQVPSTPERIRVGLIGCGGRGTGAAIDCVNSSPNIEICAMGDLFQDYLDKSLGKLAEIGDRLQVPPERRFIGFDAYQGVLACDVEMVILGTPPHFRPEHLAAAIKAGKHVFMEKPVGVDPEGIRSVIASSELAEQKGLGIVAGTQRRHDPCYVETMRRIHDGAIGEVVGGQCYWNQGKLWVIPREAEWSDMEWQCRNWLYFTWLSGDHIVEQHVHNIDVINWAMHSPPVKALGMGGRQVRTGPEYGNIYDHFSVEYEYPNGARVLSMCRQIEGTSYRVSEHLVGTRGTADPNGRIDGKKPYKYSGEGINPYVQEHADLIASIRRGRPLNEGRRIAESTLTAIMGRMSAYTGREVSFKWVLNSSRLELGPERYEFGDVPVEPVPQPGTTPLV